MQNQSPPTNDKKKTATLNGRQTPQRPDWWTSEHQRASEFREEWAKTHPWNPLDAPNALWDIPFAVAFGQRLVSAAITQEKDALYVEGTWQELYNNLSAEWIRVLIHYFPDMKLSVYSPQQVGEWLKEKIGSLQHIKQQTFLSEAEAESKKLLGEHATCYAANRTSGVYNGMIIGETPHYYLQRLSAKSVIAHPKESVDQLKLQQHYTISYKQNRAESKSCRAPATERGKGSSVQNGR